MKVLVVSDSHGRHEYLRQAIGQEAPIDLLIHAGDIEGDLDQILGPRERRGYDIKAVAGNMDWSDKYDDAITFPLAGHKVFLTHGHHYGVSYDTDRLLEAAGKCGADIAIFGHTHRPFLLEEDGVTVMNPGSVAKPRQQGLRKTYAVIMIDDKTGEMDIRFKSLPKRGWN